MISYFPLSDRNLIVDDSWISIQQSTTNASFREAHPEISRCEIIIFLFLCYCVLSTFATFLFPQTNESLWLYYQRGKRSLACGWI